MNIKINERLKTISAFINDGENIIDVGCDHGLLGIYLFLKKKNVSIISSDINEGPLEKAKSNLLKYNLENKITLKLGDGLECVSSETDTVIISGMGGLTVTEILSSIKKYPNIKKIVISPNNEFVLTRKEITKLGFKLNRETMVKENNKYYLVSEYLIGHEKINYNLGKLDFSNKTVKEYYLDLYNKNNLIIKKIPKRYILKRIKIRFDNYLIGKKICKK